MSHKLQIVQAGESRFGIRTDDIATIVPWQKPAPLPHAPNSVLGVVSIQGRMLTALDLKALTSPEASASGNHDASFLIALRGDEQLAIAVDSLGEEVEVGDRELQRQPESRDQLIGQVMHLDGTDISILNVKQIFPTAIQGRERRRRRF